MRFPYRFYTNNTIPYNTIPYLQIEGLFEDIDFSVDIKRPQFESMCDDLFNRVAGPIHQALKNANMRISEIDQIVIVGGGVRYVWLHVWGCKYL